MMGAFGGKVRDILYLQEVQICGEYIFEQCLNVFYSINHTGLCRYGL